MRSCVIAHTFLAPRFAGDGGHNEPISPAGWGTHNDVVSDTGERPLVVSGKLTAGSAGHPPISREAGPNDEEVTAKNYAVRQVAGSDSAHRSAVRPGLAPGPAWARRRAWGLGGPRGCPGPAAGRRARALCGGPVCVIHLGRGPGPGLERCVRWGSRGLGPRVGLGCAAERRGGLGLGPGSVGRCERRSVGGRRRGLGAGSGPAGAADPLQAAGGAEPRAGSSGCDTSPERAMIDLWNALFSTFGTRYHRSLERAMLHLWNAQLISGTRNRSLVKAIVSGTPSTLTMPGYLPRIADGDVESALRRRGAVLIEGVRGCGKTWTARRFARSEARLDNEGTGGRLTRGASAADPPSPAGRVQNARAVDGFGRDGITTATGAGTHS